MSGKLKTAGLALLVICFSLLVAWKWILSDTTRHAKGYNIVVISIDTTRADFLGCYGNPAISTPNIDSLAKHGVLFENYSSAINTTMAAHATMFTGLYPRNHGVGRNSMKLSDANLTMAEFLNAKGYTTAGFVGSFALASIFGIGQGFQTFNDFFPGRKSLTNVEHVHLATKDNKPIEVIVPKKLPGQVNDPLEITRPAEAVNKVFFDWLDKNKKNNFFAFVHYYDPHFPYLPPEKWYKKHVAAIPPGYPLNQQDREPYEKTFKEMIDPAQVFRPAEIERLHYPPVVDAMLKLYLAEIEYSDYAVGQVVEKLRKDGLSSRTILVVTADHGENLVDHPEFNTFFRHGFLTYETETHVPLIVYAPGVLPEGRKIKDVVSQVDFFPTLADLLGYKAPSGLDGINQSALLFEDRKPADRMIFAEASQPQIKLRTSAKNLVWVNDGNSAMVRWKDYKYVIVPYRKFEGVFHLSRDPSEEHDVLTPLIRSEPTLIDAFRQRLGDWRKKAMSGKIDSKFHVSEEDQEKLRSLGYVQ